MSNFIKSESASNSTYCAYRALWLEVIKQAFLSAMKGDRSSLIWFQATDGVFSKLCMLLDLPEQQIRKQVTIERTQTK